MGALARCFRPTGRPKLFIANMHGNTEEDSNGAGTSHADNPVQREQLRRLIAGLPNSVLTSCLLATVLVWVQRVFIPTQTLLGWLVLTLAVGLGRLALAYRIDRQLPRGLSAAVAMGLFRSGTVVAGSTWGLAGVLLFPSDNAVQQVFLAFALAGLCTGGLVAYSIELGCALGYVIPALVPFAARLFIEDGAVPTAMGLTISLFLAFVILSMRRIHSELLDNIEMRQHSAEREAQLALLQRRHRLYLQQTPLVVIEWDTGGHVIAWNQAAELTFGYAAEKVMGKHMDFLVPEDGRKALAELWRTLIAGQGGVFRRSKNLHRDGFALHCDWTSTPVFDEGGQLVSVISVAQDVTQRMQVEDDQRIAAVAFESQEGMMITDAQHRVLTVNRAFNRITGFSAEEMIGRIPDLLDLEHHDEEFVRSMRERLELNRYWAGEVWSRRKDRESHPGWLTITAVVGDNAQVTHYVQNFTDISALKAAEDHIHRLAFFDALTELPNRRLLLDRLRKSLERSHRRGSFGAIVFLDLDGFKTLNDTRGHATGDRLLVEVARRLKHAVRCSDTVARLGGDEFVVVLEELGPDQAMAASSARAIAEKVCSALAQPYVLSEHEHLGSSSLGVTLFQGLDTSVDDLLKQVDVAMYQAKNLGGNSFRFYRPDMLQAMEARSRLLSGLHEAMGQQRMQLALQLRVDHAGIPVGAEARPYWHHPTQPGLSLKEMWSLTREVGSLDHIYRWLVQTVCFQLGCWRADPVLGALTLSVTISGRNIRLPGFVDSVRSALTHSGATPDRLRLEFFDAALPTDTNATASKLGALRALGVGVSICELGASPESLVRLPALPFDQLRVPAALTALAAEDEASAALVRSAITLGVGLGKIVVADGVERPNQHRALLAMGCHHFQGTYTASPMLLDGFVDHVRRLALQQPTQGPSSS